MCLPLIQRSRLARLSVLDTDHGVVASETLPMVRGHAESLIPLTARLADKDSQNTLTCVCRNPHPFYLADRIA